MKSQPVPDDVLSAYLADDLDDGKAAALEARLAGDPELAARLDRLAVMLVELRGSDEVAPPAGFDARLARRLQAEREHDPKQAGEMAQPRPAAVSDLGQARRRRAATQRRWLLGGTAAAAVVAVALVSGLAVQQLGVGVGGGGESAGGAAAEQEAAGGPTSRGDERDRGLAQGDGGSGQEQEPASQSTEAGAAQSESGTAPGVPARGDRPVVLDRAVVLPDEAAVRARYRDLPEAERLLDVSVPQARAATRSAAAFLRRAAPLADGVTPGDCLPLLPQGGAAPSVPVRVETVVYRGQPALAYVLVEATDDARTPGRVRVQILHPDDCSTALSLRL